LTFDHLKGTKFQNYTSSHHYNLPKVASISKESPYNPKYSNSQVHSILDLGMKTLARIFAKNAFPDERTINLRCLVWLYTPPMLGQYKGYNSVKSFCSKIKETFSSRIIKFD